ncbi:HNH endonuclease [Poseidonibacter ostreae]|uniref:HNH nuclease domain-containing protein n=1 Tax=Poseidonibacter ostreae TaxID=2654171 RepID=A0ABQ6VPG3_9BACT|nr:HNH endonuclease signature motif containing protein [Poseidonibacter ostreae]KAB7892593.1 hypothetical protein GBG18_01685 [Poseidonibacter ostreae]
MEIENITNKKKCKICGREKPFKDFYPIKSGKYGIDSKCKKCDNLRGQDRRQSVDGLIKEIYKSQRNYAEKNNTALSYSREDFIEWIEKQEEFEFLYKDWQNNNYEKMFTPSCYRIDSEIKNSYSLENLGIAIWKDIQIKRGQDIKEGRDNRINKSVLQYTKEGKFIKRYHSSAEAERYLQEQNNDSKRYSIGIINCKNGKAKSAYGFKWREDSIPTKKILYGKKIKLKHLNNYLIKDIENILSKEIPISTEKEETIKCRIGQGKFRDELIKYWGACAVSLFDKIELLMASHIKPWRDSTNKERLDIYNGLLLTPNLDKVFDKGLISFDIKGNILISESFKNYNLFGINENMKIKIEEEHKKYLKYHQKNIFK